MRWHRFTTDVVPVGGSGWSLSCHVSPEAAEFLTTDAAGADPAAYLLEVRHRQGAVFIVRVDRRVRKNCIAFPVDAFFNDRPELDVRLVPIAKWPGLKLVQLRVLGRHHHEEDVPVREELLALLLAHPVIPVCSGSRVLVKSSNSQKYLFAVSDTAPFRRGLITRETEIKIASHGDGPAEADSDILAFAAKLILSNGPRPELKHVAYPFRFSEIPTATAYRMLDANDRRHFNVSATIFVPYFSAENGWKSNFCSLKSAGGKTIVLHFVRGDFGEERCGHLFATPPLMQHLQRFFGPGDHSFQFFPFADQDVPEIPVAEEAKISFLSSSSYNAMSTTEADAVLAAFFEHERYILPESVNEIVLKDNADHCPHLTWQSLEQSSIYFHMLPPDDARLKDKRVGFWVDKHETKLFQRGMTRSHLPPSSVRGSTTGSSWLPKVPPHMEKIVKDVLQLVRSSSLLLCGLPGTGKDLLFDILGERSGCWVHKIDSFSLVGDASGTTEAKIRQTFSVAREEEPVVLILQDVGSLAKNKEGQTDHRVLERLKTELDNVSRRKDFWLIGDCTDLADVSQDLAGLFSETVVLSDLTKEDLVQCLQWSCDLMEMKLDPDVDANRLAKKMAGLTFRDVELVVKKAFLKCVWRVTKESGDDARRVLEFGPTTSIVDFEESLEEVQKCLADSLGAPTVPSVRWEDGGGLEEAKGEIMDAIQVPLENPGHFSFRRSGILLFGPPGVGKTLLAKAVATECSLNFLSVKGPELLNMYVGQSEANVREVFQRAVTSAPCVIFFDELDSLAPNRGRSGDSGGVMDRVVSQLLAELDSVDGSHFVFVIGATNRPDLVDPALLRPGRFDRLVYLGVAETISERRRILESVVRKVKLSPDIDLDKVLSRIPTNVSGADISAIAADASLKAVARKISELNDHDIAPDLVDREVTVSGDDFEAAIADFSPSISAEDLQYYESIKSGVLHGFKC